MLKGGKLKEESYHSKHNVHEPMLLAALKDVRIRHVGKSPEAGHLVVVDEGGQVRENSSGPYFNPFPLVGLGMGQQRPWSAWLG